MKKLFSISLLIILAFGCKKNSPLPTVLSSAKVISSLSFTKANNPSLATDVIATIDQNTRKITASFLPGTSLNSLVLSFVISANSSLKIGSSLQTSDVSTVSLNNPVTFIVTAQDGTTQDYVLTSDFILSSEKKITSFSFTKTNNTNLASDIVGTIDETNRKISATFPIGTNIKTLKASFIASANSKVNIGTIEQFSGVTINDFSMPVTYSVKAQNGTTVDYVLTCTVLVPTIKDFYAVGHEAGTSYNVAKIWKNGVATNLSNGTTEASAEDITVVGNDVYVVGYIHNGTKDVAVMWKNGVVTNLTSGAFEAKAHAVKVVGNDVYVTGYERHSIYPNYTIAKIWKNGIATSLTDGSRDNFATSVEVVGSDVYVSGYGSNGSVYVAKVWKNGVLTSLTDGTKNAKAYDITVVGTDVYVAGSTHNGIQWAPKYWKNGTIHSLQVNTGFSEATAIKVVGSDVYTVGFEDINSKYVATMWLNGNVVKLTDGSKSAKAKDISIIGSDIYIAGFENNHGITPTKNDLKYWKNGVSNPIASNAHLSSVVQAIFITTQ